MNRQTGIALVAAAVIGTTGGVVFAVASDRSPAARLSASPAPTSLGTDQSASSEQTTVSASGSSSSTESSPAPSTSFPTPSKAAFGVGVAKDNAPLLYLADKRIHDGDEVIPISGIKGVSVISIDRLATGYLVGTGPSGDQESSDLHLVDTDGSSRQLTRTTYSYDINLAKDRIVAIDYASKRAVVWSSEGKVIGRTDQTVKSAATANVGFAEDQVAIVSPDSGDKPTSILWDPETSTTEELTSPALLGMGVSPGGSFMAGNTIGGKDEGGCLGVTSDNRADNQHQWSACDWRSFGHQGQFSPDGSRVLAVPVLTDGFGPGELAAFGVKEGPNTPVGNFTTPDLTTDAVWADDTHLWVMGARGGDDEFDKGAWIRKCDFDGRCETVATTDQGDLVLGGGVY